MRQSEITEWVLRTVVAAEEDLKDLKSICLVKVWLCRLVMVGRIGDLDVALM